MENKNYKICLLSDGCPQRGLDCSRLKKYFELNGCILVEDPEYADYIISFACGIHSVFIKRNLKYIKNLMKRIKGELIVAGCLPIMVPEQLRKIFKGRVMGTKHLDDVDDIFKDFKIKFSDIPDDNFTPNQISSELRKATPYLRISWGCTKSCSYCVVPMTVGPFRSKPLNVCLKEYRDLLNKGYRDFFILAEDTGGYGEDINSSFPELLKKLSETDKEFSVSWHIHHFNPEWAIKYKVELINVLKQGKIKSIQIPIEAGNKRILQLMNRYNDIDKIKNALFEFKNANSDVNIQTHYMVGFPSETEGEFYETLDFIKSVKFNEITLVPVTEHEKRPVYRLPGRIDEKIKITRINIAENILKEAGIKVLVRKEDTQRTKYGIYSLIKGKVGKYYHKLVYGVASKFNLILAKYQLHKIQRGKRFHCWCGGKLQTLKKHQKLDTGKKVLVRKEGTEKTKYGIYCLLKGEVEIFHQKLVYDVANKFNVKEGIIRKAPSHITLKYPFDTENSKEVENVIKIFCEKHQSAPFKLKGYGHKEKSAAFIDVVPSEKMQSLYSELVNELEKLEWMPWYDHEKGNIHFAVPIAHGDVNESNFDDIWDYINRYNAEFDVILDNITLFRLEKGMWKIHKEYPLNK